MTAKRRVKMMWDYLAFPLWPVADEAGPWSRDEVRISDQLRTELQSWSDEWTELMWGEWKPPPDDVLAAWDERGRSLLARVRKELGPQFEVGYRNERSHEVEWPTDEQ